MIWWWAACTGVGRPAAEITVVFGSRGEGEIEPCGCSERPVGGLARRNGALAAKREKGPLVVVDAGETLGPDPETFDLRFLEQRHQKADLIAQSLALAGIDAMALGAQDWRLGTSFVRGLVSRHQLPVLAANLVCADGSAYPASKVVEIGGRRVGIVGITDGVVDGCEVTNPVPAILAAVQALGPVDVVVGLVPYASDRSLAGHLPGPVPLDIVVDARGRSAKAGAEQRSDTWYVGAGAEMHDLSWMRLGFVEGARGWTTDGHAEKVRGDLEAVDRRLKILDERIAKAGTAEDRAILSRQADAYRGQQADLRRRAAEVAKGVVQHQFALGTLDLDETVPDDPATAAAVARVKAAMEVAGGAEGARGFVPRVVEDASSPWLGGEGCVACHKEQHAQWSTTNHVRAWQALEGKDRTMDQDCWSCHVTAANVAGGPTDPATSGGFHDVQCEACHGPGRAHAVQPQANTLVKTPGPEVCVRCHDGKRDGGRFDFETYRARISH